MKCILDTLTSLVAKTRDTGSFSVPILPLPTQVFQAPFPWLHFMVALNCNRFSYSRFPIWVSLYSCFYCILSNKGLSFWKEVCYAPFNSCMCVYCICWVVWECINWKWSKLSVGHILASLPLIFKHRNSSAFLVIIKCHLCELPSYPHVFT